MENQSVPFRLAINMSGAVSAGAYTAGVLDFLMEALEQWQLAKDSFRQQLAGHLPTVQNVVPLHDVCIDAFTGASAGGMCAAISAAMVQGPFQHVKTGDEPLGYAQPPNLPNTFYDSWVNRIDIREFLKTDDLDKGQPLVSLLDCTILDTIASSALTLPKQVAPRPYVNSGLSLFLMLTNVRGVTYPLYVDASMALEEHIAYYGDKLRFQITSANSPPAEPTARPLPIDGTGPNSWPLLQQAAKATGAVPLVLAPGEVDRNFTDYTLPPWKRVDDSSNVGGAKPEFPPPGPGQPQVWTTLNVDGGLTDNDPMELANDFLAMNNPLAAQDAITGRLANPADPTNANCTVITVAPFPAMDGYDSNYFNTTPPPTNLYAMLGRLLTVFLSQSRFLGETLSDLTQAASFSRFIIAPSDPDLAQAKPNEPALQCGSLGAFGGFLDRKFRKHDFLLGRRNCQKFLAANFVLPVTNPIIANGLKTAGPWAGSVLHFFKKGPPPSLVGSTPPPPLDWMPIIPLCGTALAEVPPPAREQMTQADLDNVVNLAMQRIKAIKDPLLAGAPWILRSLASLATSFLFAGSIKSALKDTIRNNLGDNISP